MTVKQLGDDQAPPRNPGRDEDVGPARCPSPEGVDLFAHGSRPRGSVGRMADPTAPAIIRRSPAAHPASVRRMPFTAPLNEVAPDLVGDIAPICTEVMTPKGMATRIVGSSETRGP